MLNIIDQSHLIFIVKRSGIGQCEEGRGDTLLRPKSLSMTLGSETECLQTCKKQLDANGCQYNYTDRSCEVFISGCLFESCPDKGNQVGDISITRDVSEKCWIFGFRNIQGC